MNTPDTPAPTVRDAGAGATTSAQAAESDSMLTLDEHDRWMQTIEHDGWGDVAADKVYARAVEAVAWELIEQTSDTSDREPSAETHRDAMLTAHRLLGALRSTSPGPGAPS